MTKKSSSSEGINKEFYRLLFLENSERDDEDEDEDKEEQDQFKDNLDILYDEVTNPDYTKNSNNKEDKAPWLEIFRKAIPYIVDKPDEPDDIKNKKGYPWGIRPLTFEGYCDSFRIGFNIHFMEKTKSYLPIRSGLNENKKALWGKLLLKRKAIKKSEKYGITSFSNNKNQHYVFVKFKDKKDGNHDADKNRGLYLRLDVHNIKKGDDGNYDIVEYFEIIRKIIRQRDSILQKFAHDLSSGTLKHILEERDAHRALAISKVASHGENEETRAVYYPDCNDGCDEAQKQILLLNSNRTLSVLYQKESEYFESEYKINEKSLEKVSKKNTTFPTSDYSNTLAKKVWDKISNGNYTIEVDMGEKRGKGRIVTIKGKKDFFEGKTVKWVKYPPPSLMLPKREEILLDFIFLLAYNSGKHCEKKVGEKAEIDFNIESDGQFIIFRSSIGCTEYDKTKFENVIWSLAIPPYVRSALPSYAYIEEPEKEPEDIPGVTLWSLSRYFGELYCFSEKELIQIKKNGKDWEGGYDYFKIQVKWNKDKEKYDFILKIKALKNKKKK